MRVTSSLYARGLIIKYSLHNLNNLCARVNCKFSHQTMANNRIDVAALGRVIATAVNRFLEPEQVDLNILQS